jgi:hypothetical protein
MGRTTRRAKKQNGVHTIRELRTSFEHMEEYTKSVAETSASKDGKIKLIRAEWQKVFFKPLARESAAALLEEHSSHIKGRRRTRKRGGAMALSGAPVEHMTRPGLYLAPGHIPNADGGLALSGQAGGGSAPYGSFVEYIDHGFGNPEIAGSSPVDWPTPAANMGSNRVGGGKKGRRVRRGGGNPLGDMVRPIVDEALSRPFSSSAPSSPLQDAQLAWKGQHYGLNPDQSHRPISYQTL